jgi:hypothetical protein
LTTLFGFFLVFNFRSAFSLRILAKKLNPGKTLVVNPPLYNHHLFYPDLPILLLIVEVGSDGTRNDM